MNNLIPIDAVFVALVILTATCALFMFCIGLAHMLEALHGYVRRKDHELQDTLWRELFGRRRS